MAIPNLQGSFVPTTNIWDVPEIYNVDEATRLLFIRLYQDINRIAIVLNDKDTGIYDNTMAFTNSQTWFPNPDLPTNLIANRRQVIRTVISFGALPNAAIKSVPHNIDCNSSTTFTRIYATASDTTGFTYLPIPFVAISGNNIEINVDATNVNIDTGGTNYSNYNICYVILEYLLF